MLAILLVFPLSCEREDPQAQSSAIRDKLLAYYYSARFYSGITVQGDLAEIRFSDGVVITVPMRVTEVLDARIRELPAPGGGDGLADGDAALQWIGYDDHYLFLQLSNGHRLVIPDAAERSLYSVSFLREDNPALPEDLELVPSGMLWTGKLPKGAAGFRLVPRFVFRGKSLYLDETPYTGGVLDFGKDLSCRIDLSGGGSVRYILSLTEDFPTIRIYTAGGAPIHSKEVYVSGRIVIDDPENRYSEMSHFEGTMQIRGRGNSTWNMPKKPYKIKLDKKASLFGVPADKDWVLLANYSDKTLLRNTVAMRISEICGLPWTPKTFPVELYLNDEYQGCYDFTEHKETSADRVKISPSGFYLEIEAKKDKTVWFDTGMKVPVMFNEPEQPAEEQFSYVRDFFEGMEAALRSENRADPQEGYAAWIDVDSFVSQYIVQELTKNIDADLFKSQFLTLEPGGKLTFAHVWDFDLALGNCDYFSGHPGMDSSFRGWYIRNYTQQGPGTGWYWYLFKDPAFASAVKARWQAIYPSLEQLSEEISVLASSLSRAAHHNFARWNILGTYVWPNVKVLGDYGAEVEYMRGFYLDRLHWMNAEIVFW